MTPEDVCVTGNSPPNAGEDEGAEDGYEKPMCCAAPEAPAAPHTEDAAVEMQQHDESVSQTGTVVDDGLISEDTGAYENANEIEVRHSENTYEGLDESYQRNDETENRNVYDRLDNNYYNIAKAGGDYYNVTPDKKT